MQGLQEICALPLQSTQQAQREPVGESAHCSKDGLSSRPAFF
jgi:hypothetical protein